ILSHHCSQCRWGFSSSPSFAFFQLAAIAFRYNLRISIEFPPVLSLQEAKVPAEETIVRSYCNELEGALTNWLMQQHFAMEPSLLVQACFELQESVLLSFPLSA